MLRRLALSVSLALAPACAPHDHPDEARVALSRPIRLVPVADDHEALGRVAEAARAAPGPGLLAEPRPLHSDRFPPIDEYFVTGPSRQVLEDMLAAPALAAPAGHAFALERLRERGGERWQVHLLAADRGLELRRVAEVKVALAPEGPPRVRLRLDGADGRAFHALTEAQLGRRIAVVVGGEVLMAPIVLEPISGAAFDISLDGADPSEAAAEALLRRLLLP